MEQIEDDPIRMLVGLITTTATTNQVQARDELLRALVTLLCSNINAVMKLWHALRGKDGVRLLISLLLPGVGVPPGPLQEYALSLLRLLSYENDGSAPAVITALVDQLMLKPIPHRPAAAPSLALRLLTQLANDCHHNQIVMVKSGALGALTTYLSLCPLDDKEAATDLLGLLFSSRQIRRHRNYKSALGAMSQLIAVLKGGGWGARCRAAKALNHLFLECCIRNDEIAMLAVPPLAEILNTTSEEEEQRTAIATLVRLLADFPLFAHGDAEVETVSLEVLCRILSSSNCSMELKRDAAELCSLIFMKYEILSTTAAACCVEPLVSLVITELGPCHLPAVKALYLLIVDNGKLAEEVVALGAVVPLVHLLKTKEDDDDYDDYDDDDDDDERLQVFVCRLLMKLGKEMPACKEEMLNAGAIKNIDDIYHQERPLGVLGFELPELLRLLTNNKRRCRKRSVWRRIPFWDAELSEEDLSEIHFPTLRGKRHKMAAD